MKMTSSRLPTRSVCPSGAHTRLSASPSPRTSLKHALVRTSQNLTTPSLLTLHNSASFVGLNATFSIEAEWPLSSVENLTCGFSGFPARCQMRLCHFHGQTVAGTNSHTRSVLSADPVATSVPCGFHAIDRILHLPSVRSPATPSRFLELGRRHTCECPRL